MPLGLAVGAIGYGVSAGMGSSASKDAAKKQQEAAIAQYQLAQSAFKKSRKELMPYSQFGMEQLPKYGQALNQYEGMLPGYNQRLSDYDRAVAAYQGAIPDMSGAYTIDQYRQSPLYTPMVTNLAELQATPGYQFQLQQGQQALGQSAAARGGMLSGAQLKAAQNFGQQQAATGFQSAWERAQQAYQNAFTQNLQRQQQLQGVLSGSAGLAGNAANLYGQGLGYQQQNVANRAGATQFGYGAATDIANRRQNAANIQGQAIGNYGNAGAQNALTQGNIWGGLAGNVLGGLGGYLGNSGATFGNVFGSTGSSPTWSGGVANTQNRMSGFADLVNSAPTEVRY